MSRLKQYKEIGFALSNPGLLAEVEAEVRKDNPGWSDKKVKTERNKRLKTRTLFSDGNKKPKKVKK